jgi:hypothetical protein
MWSGVALAMVCVAAALAEAAGGVHLDYQEVLRGQG